MAKKRIEERSVRRTGNIMRTIFIWIGVALAVFAIALLMISHGNERVVLALIALAVVVYGFVLHDLDIDDDD